MITESATRHTQRISTRLNAEFYLIRANLVDIIDPMMDNSKASSSSKHLTKIAKDTKTLFENYVSQSIKYG